MPTCVESVAPSCVEQSEPPGKLLGLADLDRLSGLDAATARALRLRGVRRVEQLRRLPKPVLVAAFGDSVGRQLWASARGLEAPAQTLWAQFGAFVKRLQRWLTESPKPTGPAPTVAVGTPDTVKA